jgi:hypothetical protein
MNVTDKEKTEQQRFFCDNCKREVFLQAKYCDNCGGEIEWSKEVKKVLATWKQEAKKDH